MRPGPSDRATLLVLRPEPGAGATAARAAALGLTAVIAPLFEVSALAWDAPDPAGFDAVMMTSANAARLGGPMLARFHALPLHAVGAATAAAARATGFRVIVTGGDDAERLLAAVAEAGVRRLLHLAGRDHVAVSHPDVRVERRIVYASNAAEALPERAIAKLGRGAVALLHSARAATLFRRLIGQAELDPARIAIASLSEAVAAAAGAGWRVATIAAGPTDDALLAAAGGLCDH